MDLSVTGPDYVVWHRLLLLSGDVDAATRLGAIHAARQSDCPLHVRLRDGRVVGFAAIIVAESAVAARKGLDESAWRRQWTGNLLKMAQQAGEDATTEVVAELLAETDRIIAHLKAARVWPWVAEPAARKAKGDRQAGGSAGGP